MNFHGTASADDDVTVAFFANPFHGPVFAAVVAKLIESVDRRPRTMSAEQSERWCA